MSENTVTGDMRDYPVQPKPFCHSSNRDRICRGGRNFQLRWLCAIRMLDEPTDDAFNRAVDDAMNKS